MSFDPEALLRRLGASAVEYVVIGGFAVIAHGVVRATDDLDIVPSPDRENLERLAPLLCGMVIPSALKHLRELKRAAGGPGDLEDRRELEGG